MDGMLGVMGPADRLPLTVMLAGVEIVTSEGEPVSVACSSNDHVPTVVRVPVDMETGEVHDAALPSLL